MVDFNMEVEGVDEAIDTLNDLQDSIEKASGEVPFDELFHEMFMKQFTPFDSINEFFEESPWSVESDEDFEDIPERELDEFVRNNTKFKSWKHMSRIATEKYLERHLEE